MRKKLIPWVAFLGFVCLVFPAEVPAVADVESSAQAIEGKLMAPCCMANPVSEHFSPAADRMRVEIRTMLTQGKSEGEILDFFVDRHGLQILAMPPARGFNLLAYLIPFLVLVAGVGLLIVAMRRWRHTAPPLPAGTGLDVDISPDDRERLRRELLRIG